MSILKLPLRFMKSGLFCMLIASVLLSCNKESKLANHIPKDASVVLALDMKSMALKSLDFKEVFSISNMKKLFESIKDTAGVDYKNCGIDFMNKAYVFGTATDAGKGFGAGIVALTDATKFEEFIKKINKDLVISQDGDFKTASLQDSMMISWNNEAVIFLVGAGKETILSLDNLKKDESLPANSDTFLELEKSKADISCWVSFENVQKAIPQYGAMMGATTDFKGMFVTATCNFEDGQIVADSKYIGSEETMKKINFTKANVSADFAKTLPGNTLIGIAGFALDMDKLYSYLESEKVLNLYGGIISQSTGLETKDLFSMLSGDIAVTVNGIEMKDAKSFDFNTGQAIVTKQPSVDYCAMIGIADKAKADQLLNHFVEGGMLIKEGNYYSFQNKVFIIENENSLAIVGTESMKKSIVEGNAEKLNDELSNLLTSNSSAFYMNVMSLSTSSLYSGDNQTIGNHIKNSEIEDMTFTASGVKDNVSTGKFLIRFKEKNENSLITLGRIFKKYSEIVKASTVAVTGGVPTDESPAN